MKRILALLKQVTLENPLARLLRKIPPRHLSRILDATFLSLSILCFALFARNSMVGVTGEGRGLPIAAVSEGSMERKRQGMLTFNEAKVGTQLFHRDAIWVGEGKSAKILFDTGALMSISEKTFLVLHRQYGKDDQIEVLTGEVKVEKQGRKNQEVLLSLDQAKEKKPAPAPGPAPSAPPARTPITAPQPSPSLRKTEFLRPKPDTVFYLAQQRPDVEITFAWTDIVPGFLVVQDAKGNELARREVVSESFARVTLKSGQSYQWSMIDRNQHVQVGPIKFQIAPFDKDALSNALMGGQKQHPIEIIN